MIFFNLHNNKTNISKSDIMPDRSRIPRMISTFNVYIISTSSYLIAGSPITNGERLELSPADISTWIGFAEEWKPIYKLYSDKSYSRTTVIKDQLLLIISRTVTFDAKYRLLDRISTSPQVTVTDMSVFNIKRGLLQKKTHTISITPVKDTVRAILKPIGGGQVYIKCLGSTAQRPGIVAGADCVQYLYCVGDTPPLSANDPRLKTGLSSRASFTLDVGAASKGKKLFIYFRWFNTRHPELAGSWSGMMEVVVL